MFGLGSTAGFRDCRRLWTSRSSGVSVGMGFKPERRQARRQVASGGAKPHQRASFISPLPLLLLLLEFPYLYAYSRKLRALSIGPSGFSPKVLAVVAPNPNMELL